MMREEKETIQRRKEDKKVYNGIIYASSNDRCEWNKSCGSLFTAKGAGNLLLKLNHPEVVFSEIVGKRP